jgi:cobalt-zinc-cadmium efflux system protein
MRRSTGHDHEHGPSRRAGARHQRPLAMAFGLTVCFLIVQIVVGLITGSLALLSDAGHMATDALGLGMALAAIHAASVEARARSAYTPASVSSRSPHLRFPSAARPSSRTFGLYRLEILAALANAVLLFGIAAYVLYAALSRLGDPPAIEPLPVLVVGGLGLAVNLVAFFLLRRGAAESLNVQGAYLEVLSDTLGSVGVIAAAIIIAITDWGWVDPVFGAAIGVFILPRAWRLGREALRVLVQAAPPGVDLDGVRADLTGIPGVVDVHDLHVWTLTSDMEVASAHVMVRAGTDTHSVLDQARHLLAERHRLQHATLQVEPDDHHGCDEVAW